MYISLNIFYLILELFRHREFLMIPKHEIRPLKPRKQIGNWIWLLNLFQRCRRVCTTILLYT